MHDAAALVVEADPQDIRTDGAQLTGHGLLAGDTDLDARAIGPESCEQPGHPHLERRRAAAGGIRAPGPAVHAGRRADRRHGRGGHDHRRPFRVAKHQQIPPDGDDPTSVAPHGAGPHDDVRLTFGQVDGDADDGGLALGDLAQRALLHPVPRSPRHGRVGDQELQRPSEDVAVTVGRNDASPTVPHRREATVHAVPADCLFCKILAGDIPSDPVRESDLAYAFRDINPAMPSHVLVVPRKHIANAHELTLGDADDLAAMYVLAREVATAEGLAERGYRLVCNVGADSGNTVPHLHLHVLGGRRMGWPPG